MAYFASSAFFFGCEIDPKNWDQILHYTNDTLHPDYNSDKCIPETSGECEVYVCGDQAGGPYPSKMILFLRDSFQAIQTARNPDLPGYHHMFDHTYFPDMYDEQNAKLNLHAHKLGLHLINDGYWHIGVFAG